MQEPPRSILRREEARRARHGSACRLGDPSIVRGAAALVAHLLERTHACCKPTGRVNVSCALDDVAQTDSETQRPTRPPNSTANLSRTPRRVLPAAISAIEERDTSPRTRNILLGQGAGVCDGLVCDLRSQERTVLCLRSASTAGRYGHCGSPCDLGWADERTPEQKVGRTFDT